MKKNEKIANEILTWYKKNGRDFLWRDESRTPYEVMVAEILLQRTTAKSVAKFYPRFIEKYPTLERLEKAKIEDLEDILSNLGLLYKAKIFKKIAQKLKKTNKYKIPDEKEDLIELYGVGDYISSAILTFAFNKNTPVIDSNIIRFSSRFWKVNSKNLIKEKLINLTSKNPRKIYFGLLDICWYYCRAPEPKCEDCPIKAHCKYN